MNLKQLFNKYKGGPELRRAAEKGISKGTVARIREGKGDHFIVYPADKRYDPIPVPNHREIATGTRIEIIKKFVEAGIILLLLFCFLAPLIGHVLAAHTYTAYIPLVMAP